MKRIILPFLFVCCAATAFSQTMVRTGGSSIGLRAGVNFFNINGKNVSGGELENKLNTGFQAGLTADFPIGTGVFLQPGVIYSVKGTEWTNGLKTTLSYAEIPLSVLYKPLLGRGNLVLGGGPYVGFGLSGETEYPNGNKGDVEFEETFNSAFPVYQQFNGIDAGANLQAGYEFASRFGVGLHAQIGLKDINPDYNNNNDLTKWKNTGFSVLLSYRF